jgi:hypothetical protein
MIPHKIGCPRSGFSDLGISHPLLKKTRSREPGKGMFVLFRGYIDESYGADRNIFALSCIIARGKEWDDFERKWKRHIAAKNRQLSNAGRCSISRYHASNCSGRHGEFNGWTLDERDIFVKGLFQVFKQVPTFTVVFDLELKELCEAFPEYREDPIEAAYYWMTILLIITIGKDFQRATKSNRNVKITMFHDRTATDGKYDSTISNAFKALTNDPTFASRDMFTSIAPLSWRDCILLQSADLVAFECFKEAEARCVARKSRKSYTALLNFEAFGIHSKTVNKENLVKLKRLVDTARQRKAEVKGS